MEEHRFRTGTVLKLRTGEYRVGRAFKRGHLLYYDLLGTNGHNMPDVLEGMITAQFHQMARFDKGDHALWKGRPCRIVGRGWSIPDQCIRYTIEVEVRTGTLERIPEGELSSV